MGSEFFAFLFLKLWLLILFSVFWILCFPFPKGPFSNFFFVFWILNFAFSLRLFVDFSYMFKASHFSFIDSFFLFLLNCFNIGVSLHGISVLLFSALFSFMYSFLYTLHFSFSSISLSSI